MTINSWGEASNRVAGKQISANKFAVQRARALRFSIMIVGVPKEIKSHEYRVALLPVGADELRRAGNKVLVERGAGLGSGIRDEDYEKAGGATIIDDRPRRSGARAEMIVKVKEPQPEEFPLIRENQILFTYFHFAADEQLTRRLLGVRARARSPTRRCKTVKVVCRYSRR